MHTYLKKPESQPQLRREGRKSSAPGMTKPLSVPQYCLSEPCIQRKVYIGEDEAQYEDVLGAVVQWCQSSQAVIASEKRLKLCLSKYRGERKSRGDRVERKDSVRHIRRADCLGESRSTGQAEGSYKYLVVLLLSWSNRIVWKRLDKSGQFCPLFISTKSDRI